MKRDLYLVAQRQRLQSFAASKFWELVAGSKEPVIS
ncbi:hypothetical protein KKC1_33170 [Calderihabitans maritimus]|uniref:Uncharacterized protein n=1 Tax=Calderihabitans maritimus TaxID=1246530 RepID=A0A1Z5HY11_9FIRM|nr:hypothetical protein KKC1_33170 [Calderihabitans maritimus]